MPLTTNAKFYNPYRKLYCFNLDLDLDLRLTSRALNTLNTDNMFDGYFKKKVV